MAIFRYLGVYIFVGKGSSEVIFKILFLYISWTIYFDVFLLLDLSLKNSKGLMEFKNCLQENWIWLWSYYHDCDYALLYTLGRLRRTKVKINIFLFVCIRDNERFPSNLPVLRPFYFHPTHLTLIKCFVAAAQTAAI